MEDAMNASGDASFTYLRTVGFGSNEKSDTVVYVPPPPKESSSPPDQKTQAIARENPLLSHSPTKPKPRKPRVTEVDSDNYKQIPRPTSGNDNMGQIFPFDE